MCRSKIVVTLIFCCSMWLAVAGAADAQQNNDVSSPSDAAAEVRIGWAWEDISPPRPTLLRGQFYARVSQETGDPVTVTAMAIESAGDGKPPRQAIMISCDLISVRAPTQTMVREALRGRVPGFDLNMLMINGTHTHTGPVFSEDSFPKQDASVMTPTQCKELFVRKAADAAERAWKNRRPAGVSSGYGQAAVGFNRRIVYSDGSSQMYGNVSREDFDAVEGADDHGVNLLFAWDEQRKLTGIVVNLACPSQQNEHGDKISADFWYETRLALRKRFGEGLFVLPQCSAAGDQSPHPMIGRKLRTAMRDRKNVTMRQEIAHRIASAVDDAFEGAKANIQTKLVFRHEVRTLELPVRMVTEQEYDKARQDVARLEADLEMEASRRLVHTKRGQRVMRRYQQQDSATTYSMELHVLRLGDVALATNPFELFLDFGTRMKTRSAAMQTFVIQLACGSASYLPTEKAMKGGGYGAEIASNRVGAIGGKVLVDRTVELIKEMWE